MTDIELFLSPADEGGQTLEEGLNEEALAHSGSVDAEAKLFPNPGGDANSLEEQGWAVAAPTGEEGDRLLELIEPLIARRREEQDREIKKYRIPRNMTASETVAWRDQKFSSNDFQEEIPWYLLVLGQPTQVSLEFQQVMSNSSLVGRLAFDRDDDYRAYAEKVLAWENESPAKKLARALFFTADDGTAATRMGRKILVDPSVKDARDLQQTGHFPVSDVVPITGCGDSAGDDLLDAAALRTPSILFSCSHGMGAPRSGWNSLDRQLALQGALCLGDGEHIAGDDLREAAFLPGGMWFYFACFGAGTPATSAYRHWLQRLKDLGKFGGSLQSVLRSLPKDGDPPFLNALPKAVLANPNGPLAVMGHLDLAWSYSFHDIDKSRNQERHRRFQGTLRDISRGHRVGLAFKSLLETRGDVQTELTVATDEAMKAEADGQRPPDDPVRLGHRWMLHQDLDGYILLGDPAARLPVDRDEVKAERKRRRKAAKAKAASQTASSSVPDITSWPAEAAPPAARETFRKTASKPTKATEPVGSASPIPGVDLDQNAYLWGRDKNQDEKAKDKVEKEPGMLERFGRKVTDTLGKAIADALELEVKTYVSSDLDKLADSDENPIKAANAKLRAYTRAALDGDMEVIVPSTEDGQIDEKLWELHKSMVEQAQEHRAEMLKIMLALVKPSSS